MPDFQVKTFDGKTVTVRGKEGTTQEQAETYYRRKTAPGPTDKIQAVGQGVNVGMADVAGTPVTLANEGLGFLSSLAGSPATGRSFNLKSENPVLGQGHLRELLDQTGLGYSDASQIDPRLRPYAKGGEAFGGGTLFSMIPLARGAYLGTKPATGITAPIVEGARRRPLSFGATETGMGAAAGGGRAAAEMTFPGNELVGTGAEIAAGTLNPFSTLSAVFHKSGGLAGRVRTFLPGGAESTAGKIISRELAAGNEDSADIMRQLLADDEISGAPLPSGIKADSDVLRGLQNWATGTSTELGNRVGKRLDAISGALNAAYRDAVEGGNPQLVKEAAEARQQWFKGLLQTKVALAEKRAMESVDEMAPVIGREEASFRARSVIEDSLKDARAQESKLWNDVPDDVDMETSNTVAAYKEVSDRILQEERYRAPIEPILRRIRTSSGDMPEDPFEMWQRPMDSAATDKAIKSGELKRLRSILLRQQRDIRSSSQPDWDMHRRLGELADGVLADMEGLPGAEGARAFSRELNNHYSRGIAGQVLGTNARGAPSINPEETLAKTIAGGNEGAAVNARQMEAAAQGENLPGVTPRTVQPEQQEYLKDLAFRAVDPVTGRINPKQLERWRTSNRELLKEFPEIEVVTRSAFDAERMLKGVEDISKSAQKAADSKRVWAKVAGVEDPVVAVQRILTGDNPVQGLSQLAKAARLHSDPAQALAGLRTAIVDAVIDASKGSQAAANEMVLGGRGESLLDAATKMRIFSGEQRAAFKRILLEGKRIEDNVASKIQADDPTGLAGNIEDLATRIIGANLGSLGAASHASGASLVMAGAGSRTARNMMQNAPNQKVRDVIYRAIEEPKYMAELLGKSGVKPTRQKQVNTAQLRAYLLQAGVPTANNEEEQ